MGRARRRYARGALTTLQSLGLDSRQAVGAPNNRVQDEAVMVSTDHIFLISALMFLFVAAEVWLAPRPKGQIAAVLDGR